MAKRSNIDWEKGERLYRLGQLSATEIGKQIVCSTTTVIRHMEKVGVTRDLAEEVLRRTQEAIATQCNETQRVAQTVEEDIQEAVNTNVALVMSHRKDIGRLVEVENKLLDELNGNPTKLYIAQFQGQIIQEVVALTVLEKTSALVNISNVQAKRIDKQRQAFGMKEGDSAGQDDAPIRVVELVAFSDNRQD